MESKNLYEKRILHSSIKLLLVFLLIFTNVFKAECQKSDTSGSVFTGGSYEKTFSTSRIGVGQSVMTTPAGEFHIVIQHRFGELSGGFSDFFGFDGAVARFGFDYGITNWLSAGIGRSMFEKTYDLGLKAVILKQKDNNVPVSLSYYFAALENTIYNNYPAGHNSFGSGLSYVNQLFIARNQGIFSFQVSPLWLHSNFEARTVKTLDLFAIDLDGRIRLGEKFGLIAEYIPVLTREPFTGTNPFTVGLDINTGGHQFQLILSNSQGLNEKAITTNTTGSWTKGHIFFGFNLTRVFNGETE
jgi:hypothetical protein